MTVPAAAERLVDVRHQLDSWARRAGVAEADREALTLATYEAMANVVVHAYPDGHGELRVEAVCLPGQGRVQVTVTDRGSWRTGGSGGGQWGGRGIPLIRALAANVSIESGARGTKVRMDWPWASAQ
ncbi:MAG TPA: ATP-binding protein [Amycolatopsis sp.]|nr:ATP-binding protein [Amycolatopsis sp.]